MALNFDSVLPEGMSLYDFQTVGVAYTLATDGRTIIGDEMGLGKTIQALVTLQVRNAFPAVVVCPASLKGNWAKEIRRAFPGWSICTLSGVKVPVDLIKSLESLRALDSQVRQESFQQKLDITLTAQVPAKLCALVQHLLARLEATNVVATAEAGQPLHERLIAVVDHHGPDAGLGGHGDDAALTVDNSGDVAKQTVVGRQTQSGRGQAATSRKRSSGTAAKQAVNSVPMNAIRTSNRGNRLSFGFALDCLLHLSFGEFAKLSHEDSVAICNYDILSAWETALSPAGLVLDESHYCKEAKSQRTQAAIRLAAKVPADGAVLLLTGTALLNRPVELLAQLQILGKLEEVTGPAKNPEGKFLYRYCGPETNKWGTTFKGATNLAELQTRLRSTCFVRRLRKDALGMNDTVRIPTTLSLNGDLDTYRRAERDFGGYLAANGKANSGDAQAIRQLTELRKLAGLAKVSTTIEWIENWLDSNEGQSIVVFAWHVAVQKALVEHFGCPSILAGQSTDKTEAAKELFQNRSSRIIVLSILAAKEGHTLTAASDVLFVEQPWNPGVQQQAEDRINRIGQEAAQCFATSLLAEDTVDEMVYELIESKRQVIKSVMDSGVVDADDATITDAILNYLRTKYTR